MSSEALWTAEAFVTATGGEVRGALPDSASGISIDSRSIEPGEVFFAIKGDRLDGHDFVGKALAAGAGLAVVDRAHADRFAEDRSPLVVVDDTLDAMRKLARAARARSKARIIGVTGSVGKTGTKEALKLTLSPSGETYASAQSFNNHWGVPLSLSRFPERAAFGVFEMGMNHAGEITPLTQMVRPHIAIITTVEPVHLEFFESVDGIADAKAEIFHGLEPDGVAVLNRDNEHYERLAGHAEQHGARIVSFGKHADADARLIDVSAQEGLSCVVADILGERITYKIGAPGAHFVQNSLAVLAAVHLAGGDLARAGLAYQDIAAPSGRGAQVDLTLPGGSALLIDESYNANPASVRAALSVLGQTPTGLHGRRIVVLGDMLELGPTADARHAALAEPATEARADLVHCVGPLMGALWHALPEDARGRHVTKSDDLVEALVTDVRPGDVIMVKGSLGTRMAPLVSALKTAYPPSGPSDAA
ncbi:MAG: UDP-N-acetylmuramoylalanyl-D-glutamyl-2,6-diaminopimelate--D-alanyl-D-alanine ligase [Pseudomonadota bacterium]